MKKFEFPLGKVARWSQQQLTMEQLALARVVQELTAVEDRLRSLRAEVLDSQSRLQSQTILTGYELVNLTRFVQKLAEERSHLQQVRSGIARKVEEQRQRVVAGHRKVKLFENLHHRRREEWLQELGKSEDALASDLFLAKVAREQQESNVHAEN